MFNKCMAMAVILIISLLGTAASVTAESDVTIYVDEEMQQNQQALIDEGRTFVPIRGVFEAMGARVHWDQEIRTVFLDHSGQALELSLNSDNAVINNEIVRSNLQWINKDGRVYIPLRFTSESLGADVYWDGENREVHIKQEREMVKSAADAPLSLQGYTLGESSSELQPADYSTGLYEWVELEASNAAHEQVAVNAGGEVSAMFTTLPEQLSGLGIFNGADEKAVNNLLGSPDHELSDVSKGWNVYSLDDKYVTVFFAPYRNYEAVGVLIEAELKENQTGLEEEADAFAAMLLQLANAERQAEGLNILQEDHQVQESAQNHADYMVENDEFGHIASEGYTTPFDRMRAAGVDFDEGGENIARGHRTPMHAHMALMNSSTHRHNILHASYTHIGVGVSYQEERPYAAQNFASIQ
ncbi:copper amine oxidase-like protein [Salsuginibacillus halophilus]|uniref:Copper amine oxidase-like protein n=1 Tax=Salsuginibacillus halophilus TaxID=517424 RepID=A0A2P8HQN0_9BACI|nr:stalk domain-containing protein [Salsuginibacillus halophilus]PSL48519.1 copper amine oxidase-like protein [Salsuginibacillus halophilus]